MLTSIILIALAQQAATVQDVSPARLLTGLVIDTERKPIGGADVWLSGFAPLGARTPVFSRTVTDAQGHFRVSLPPDQDGRPARQPLAIWAYRHGSAIGALSFERSKLPEPEGLKLVLGGPAEYRFRVVGPDGQPVAGARITPFFARTQGLPYSLPMPEELADRFAVRTDEAGTGTLAALRAESLQIVRARSERFGGQRIAVKPGEDGVGTIALAPVGSVSARVVADDPDEIRNKAIVVMTIPDATSFDFKPGEVEVNTGADGRFEIAAMAVGKLKFFVRTEDAQKPVKVLWPTDRSVAAGQRTEVEVSLDGSARTRIVEGVVRDRVGQPVAGATVLQSGDGPKRTRAITDDQGRFRLPGVNEGKAFVFVTKAKFPFQGQLIDQAPAAVEVVIARSDEPPLLSLTTLPPLLPHAEELKLARRLIDAYVEKVLKDGDEGSKVKLLESLAGVDPVRTLDLLEKNLFPDPFFNEMFRMRVVEGLARESPEEAQDVIESMQAPFTKALAYVKASSALPASQRVRKRDLLELAALQARGTKEPEFRLAALGAIADQLLDLGETERATQLLREGQAVAKELPNAAFAGYAKGAFAEELAQIDLKAALELTKDLSDPREYDRHHGNIAHELAGKDPAGAERVLEMEVKHQPSGRDYSAIRVCYRMARADLERARRIAGTIKEPRQQAYALGVMAQALAGSDKVTASSLLAEAFDALERTVDAGGDTLSGQESAAVTGATLLPVAEAIDPKLAPEYFWRSLSLRRPDPADPSQEANALLATATLAMRLARYDRAVARAILEPTARRAQATGTGLLGTGAGVLLVAAAAIDPRWAVELIEAIPEPSDLKSGQPQLRIRLAVASFLTRQGERRWQHLQWSYMHLWVPDQEDIVPDF